MRNSKAKKLRKLLAMLNKDKTNVVQRPEITREVVMRDFGLNADGEPVKVPFVTMVREWPKNSTRKMYQTLKKDL